MVRTYRREFIGTLAAGALTGKGTQPRLFEDYRGLLQNLLGRNVTGNPAAQNLLRLAYRKPWEHPYNA